MPVDARGRAPGRVTPTPVTAANAATGLAESAWHSGQQHAARGDVAGALRWQRRAQRLAPRDPMVAFTLATLLLRAGDHAEASALFTTLVAEQDAADAWAGLAAAARAAGEPRRADAVLAVSLARIAPTPSLRRLAAATVAEAGLPGWCGLDAAGQLHVAGQLGDIGLDGRVLAAGAPLPEGWRRARSLAVSRDGRAFLGSPLQPDLIARTEGVVSATADGGVEGWAWHPADPARDPELRIVTAEGTWTITATEPVPGLLPGRLFARPRRFALPPLAGEQPIRVLDAAGRDLLGSPLDPGAERRAAVVLAHAAAGHNAPAPTQAAIPVGVRAITAISRPRRPAEVDVIVPVHRGLAQTLACLDSVLATVPPGTRVHVVDDASPEPELAEAVRALAAEGRVRLVRHAENRGFPAAANAGLRAAGRRDAILLNSDTLVPPGWLERLRKAAYSAQDAGSVTPLSNDATLASYPEPNSPPPGLAGTHALDRLAQRANGALTAEVPTGVGFCLYLRRDCLDSVGLFRELPFAQGYGEENDWCLRARALGWRHLVAAGVFVAHVGGQSFGGAREHLMRRNLTVLNRLHPGYDALIAAHAEADPLAAARRRMDALRWRAGRRGASAILVTHAGGGGVDRVVAQRCAALRAAGWRALVLRPQGGQCRVEDDEGHYPNLLYRLPRELPRLAALLRGDRPAHVELHHLLGHDASVLDLAAALGVPWDAYVHDYAWFCPRISLLSYGRRYCGEPEMSGCEACIADLGSHLEESISVRELVARSARALGGARQVIAPSADAAARIRRHFPAIQPLVVPWELDPARYPAPGRAAARRRARRRIAVVGALGPEKGYDVLLACVRDAQARTLPLEFVVVGHTEDDARLLAAGPVFVTGRYEECEAVALIRDQNADFAFLPSIWPETWCFALTRAWEAGLPVAAFDLGAPAERIRRSGGGWLLPLGLSASGINAALLGVSESGRRRSSGNALRRLAPGGAPLHSPASESTIRIP